MDDQTGGSGLLPGIIRDFRSCWKDLALADIAYKIVGVVILFPLAGLLFRGFLALSGRSVLADQDIAHFFLSWVGLLCLIVMGAVGISIAALEMAALMAIAWSTASGERMRARTALFIAMRAIVPLLRTTARLIAIGLLTAAPFLALGGLLFFLLLTEFDINYYLTVKPPVFWVAVLSIGAVLLAMTLVLIRVLSRYVYALPLLLFEGVGPGDALSVSRERATGHRMKLVWWLAAWAAGSTVLHSITSAVTGLLGGMLLPSAAGSLALLALATGVMVLFWALVNFAVTLVSTSFLALGVVRVYRTLGLPEGTETRRLVPEGAVDAAPWLRLSRAKLIGGFALALILALVIGTVALQSFELEDRTTVTAHRGASGAAPENSLAAFRRAIADKADWIELDVQLSSDGVVMVFHDRDLKKIGGSDLVVAASTAEELRQVDIGSSFSPEFRDERMPSLDEVLELCKGKIGVNIELKYYGPSPDLSRLVVERVEAHAMQDQVVVMSLDHDAIARLRVLRPEWKVGVLAAMTLGDLTSADADFLAVSTGMAGPGFISRAHAAGKEVHVWTVNDPVAMSSLISIGADSLITDEPARARQVLEQRMHMSPVERLLVELATYFGVSRPEEVTADDA